MKVLYVNHTALIGGGEHSLLELLRGLPDDVAAELACPEGPLADAARALGHRVTPLPAMEGSLRLHPAHTPLALLGLARAALAARRAAEHARADVVHANSLRAGLIAALAGPPVVTQARDCLPPTALTRASGAAIERTSALILANSAFTRDRLAGVRQRARVRVVHPPVDLARFAPSSAPSAARAALGLPAGAPVLAVVAQITAWKRQDLAIRALAALGGDARLLLIGSPTFLRAGTRLDNRAYLRELEALVARLGLGERVRFLGERADVPDVLAAADLLLAPAAQEPFGRAVVEAMAMGVPPVASRSGGPAEVIRDGVDGVLVAGDDPLAWAAAIAPLLEAPDSRERMASAGREAAARFALPAHVAAITAIYAELAARSPSSSVTRMRRRPR